MKNIFLLMAFACLFVTACQDDEQPNPGDVTLSLDGENNSGPLFPSGEYEAAVFFDDNTMSEHANKFLKEVRWFMGPQFPEECRIKIYGKGTNSSTPGDVLYEANVTNNLVGTDWNSLELANPVELNGEEIWVSVFLKHNQDHQSLGCDAGPNRNGGDWLYQDADNNWEPYSDRTPESINWNIRAVVGE